MKRAPFFLTIGFVATIALGYFLIDKFYNSEERSVWEFIPDGTVMAYEVGDCKECLVNIKKSPLWELCEKLLLRSGEYDTLRNSIDFLMTPQKGEIITVHITQKDDFDFLFFIPLQQVDQIKSLKQSSSSSLKFSDREFNGVKINEIKYKTKTFSWTILENYWIGSYTPFLVEDAIRTETADTKSEFLNKISGVTQLPRIKMDAGNIYVDHRKFFDWISIFTEKSGGQVLDFGLSSLLDLKQSENNITVNGFSLSPNQNSFLSLFENQTPVPFSINQFISERTVYATVFGISNGSEFYQKLKLSRNKSDLDSLQSLTGKRIDELYRSLGKELAVCRIEARSNTLAMLIGFQTGDTENWIDFLNKLSDRVEKGDTVFYEKYSSYVIREIDLKNLPGKLFEPIVDGFEQTYYTYLRNTFFLCDDLEELKSFLDDLDHEEVWGKSIAHNRFLESTLLESNVSLFINIPRALGVLQDRLSPKWKKFIQDNQNIFRLLDYSAIQFSHLNESFYTNAVVEFDNANRTDNKSSFKPSERIISNLNDRLISKPFIVRNHSSKQDEIVVQDSTFNIHQLDVNGKLLWSLGLEGKILGDIQQVDYFSNNKLQLFFVTDKTLHVVDRLGNYVSPFPVKVNVSDIEFAKVVDYDKSKNYRFFISDKYGKLWLFNKSGEVLDGWNPNVVGGPLFSGANHHRIRGKDYMIAIRRDGWAYLMNRRGENLKGFPLDLDARPEGDYFLDVGNSLASSSFVVISRDGFRIKFNLEGKIISKETLIKPSVETTFSLIKEGTHKAYLIKRQDSRQLSLLDENLKEVVRNDYVGKNPVRVRYYDFGSGRMFISITDLIQDLSYVYDGKGNLLTKTPLETEGLEIRLNVQGKPVLMYSFDTTLIIQPL